MTAAEEFRARLEELDRQRRAPMPTVEQIVAWRDADLILAPRLRAICPGVPLHHIHAVLSALHSTQHVDGSQL